jgi:hypothetical protein
LRQHRRDNSGGRAHRSLLLSPVRQLDREDTRTSAWGEQGNDERATAIAAALDRARLSQPERSSRRVISIPVYTRTARAPAPSSRAPARA